METGSRFRSLLQDTPTRILILLLALVAYLVIFAILYPIVGEVVAALVALPLGVAGLVLGTWGGLMAAILAGPVVILQLVSVTQSSWQFQLQQDWPGLLVGLLVGVATGRLRDLVRQVQAQAIELRRARDVLESRVREQTAALLRLNQELVREIQEHEQAQLEIQQRADEFLALHETTRDLASHHDLAALLQTVIERAAILLHAPGAAIYLYDKECGDLHILAVRDSRNPPVGARLQMGEGIAGHVAETLRPVIVDDYRTSSLRTSSYADLPITAVVEVPMVFAGQLIGVLVLDEFETATRKFTQEDIRLLDLFAGHAASAVHNARIFGQLRNSRERLQTLSHSLLQAQENERRHIARELHDEIGQVLTGIQLNLQALEPLIPNGPVCVPLVDSRDTVEQVMQQVRGLALELRPSILDDFGLVAALEWYANRAGQRSGLTIEFASDPLETRLPVELETVCFRVAQEAITNVTRHAQTKHVHVELRRQAGQMVLSIQDNGIGFDCAAALGRAARGESLGLLGMQERVLLAGGQIQIESAPEHGTLIRAYLPLSESDLPLQRRVRGRERT